MADTAKPDQAKEMTPAQRAHFKSICPEATADILATERARETGMYIDPETGKRYRAVDKTSECTPGVIVAIATADGPVIRKEPATHSILLELHPIDDEPDSHE